jgi:UDP-N-acetylmuramate--alanine ligase
MTDIYSAFETPIANVNVETLLQAIQQVTSIPSYYIPRSDLVSHLSNMLCAHDVVLTLGAGKITYLHDELLAHFKFKKLKVGLIFGGQSYEHEISIRSARFVAQSLNRNLYDVRFFGIDKAGQWIVGQEAERLLDSKEMIESSQATSLLNPTITYELEMCDLYLPILHGTHGEDGTIQGFFEMLNKPYVGPDYRSAAICMDKILTKRIAAKEGILTPRDLTFGYRRWKEEPEKILNEIFDQFPMPLYVKPVHLGSSIGITPVFEPEQLKEAIALAFRYDTQVMVEEGKVGCRELEFAVVGNTGSFSIAVPGPGEKLAAGDFVDYEKKYGTNAVKTTLHPDLSSDIIEKGKQLAQKAYEAIGCTGMTRVDFLLDPHGQFWLFEMNSIPGLTQLSLFPKIWNRDGLNCDQLIDRLIILSLARHRQHKQQSAISLK